MRSAPRWSLAFGDRLQDARLGDPAEEVGRRRRPARGHVEVDRLGEPVGVRERLRAAVPGLVHGVDAERHAVREQRVAAVAVERLERLPELLRLLGQRRRQAWCRSSSAGPARCRSARAPGFRTGRSSGRAPGRCPSGRCRTRPARARAARRGRRRRAARRAHGAAPACGGRSARSAAGRGSARSPRPPPARPGRPRRAWTRRLPTSALAAARLRPPSASISAARPRPATRPPAGRSRARPQRAVGVDADEGAGARDLVGVEHDRPRVQRLDRGLELAHALVLLLGQLLGLGRRRLDVVDLLLERSRASPPPRRSAAPSRRGAGAGR